MPAAAPTKEYKTMRRYVLRPILFRNGPVIYPTTKAAKKIAPDWTIVDSIKKLSKNGILNPF